MNINAPSTIAMSAYSIAALNGPTTKLQFLTAFSAYQFACTPEQLDEAIDLALARGLMKAEYGLTEIEYEARGPRGWVAMDRDPSDEGGWSGWTCKNLATGAKKTLESLLKEPI